ncbi:hypothetical protein COT97_02255 [Candidatus Falkowbacteria bacterium CG10_big_fil_rev_8_21_14_0_10_39_11]|uniref:Glycosyl transferase family 1 domain-containing protein n=1 Tax=Candidatus Falkowbacteria bacterium CG10_big_fil_rev_8_21_14_0_10_39_11 TaxID=1974565 RepID=A0A2H0V5E3_9BACT|nr:MAG: hypothetical protein COT97_02255 [Candidatus Falkowbacteria bacterium CG10_big_fil_rev_8_21_14_0_10_39_11]
MKIGIDCRQIYDVKNNRGAGIPRYVFNLVKAIMEADSQNEYVLFFDDNINDETLNALRTHRGFKVVKVKNKVPFFSAHVGFTFKLWAEWLDWCIFPANIMPFFYVGKSTLIIHDLLIYNYPQWFPNKQWFSKLLVVPSSIAKATNIMTISEATKSDLLFLFKFKKAKDVIAVHSGVEDRVNYNEREVKEVEEKFKIKKEFLFFVGTIEPRKNLRHLFQVFGKYIQEYPGDMELIVAGIKGWKYRKIFKTMIKINNKVGKQVIRYVGKVSDNERNVLMQQAKCFVFPSHNEGFGLPILEAMQQGVPVIASKIPVTQELVVGGEALLVPPDDQIDLFTAIKKVLDNEALRNEMIEKGKERVKNFKWSVTAKALLKFIELPDNNDE